MNALTRLRESVSPFLLDAAWRATAMIAIVFMLTKALGRKRPAATHTLWVYCLAGALIVPVTPLVASGVEEGQVVSLTAEGPVRGCNRPPTSWAFAPWGSHPIVDGAHVGNHVIHYEYEDRVTVAVTAGAEKPAPTSEGKRIERVNEGKAEPEKEKGYESAFSDLYDELGGNYPAFGIKGIDWKKVGEELLPRVKEVKTDEEFGLLCAELVARLEDSHAYLMSGAAQVPSVPFPQWDPGFACLIDDRGKPVVYYVDRGGPAENAGIRIGMTLVSINGEGAAELMEKRMKEIKRYSGYSSDRYFRYHVAQWLGRQMDRGAIAELEVEDVDGQTHKFRVAATLGVRYLPRLPVPIRGISDSANVSWKILDDDVGYIYVRRIREDLIPGLDRAVGVLKDARGLIVDVRGNSGGGFDSSRSHRNFSPQDAAEPQRPRFKGPIAMLIDSRCISAGEGWASWFIANKRAKVFGEATAGASSRKTVYTLSNGLFRVQYPVKAYTGFLDRPIERRGLEPDVSAKQNARDLAAGRDTVLETAKRYLLEQTPGYTAPVAPTTTEPALAGAEAKAEGYTPPDFEGYFPDDPEGGRKLDAMGENGIFQSSLPDAELLELVRNGLRRTTQRWILRAVGNRYIWGKSPQNPKAIEIMYHATDGPDMSNAVYFGLSVVQDKSPSVLRALVDICMRSDDPNVLSRVAWGTRSQMGEILPYVTPYLNSSDEKTREKAGIVEKILTDELNAWSWSREQALARAKAGFTDKLPEIKEKLLHGDSETRREVIRLINQNAITLIMDDSFIEAWKACAEDSDAWVRNQVARTFGNHWIWNAPEQKPEAIELMLQLSRDEVRDVRYNTVYFGLSTVRDKSEAVIRRLLEIAMEDREWNMFQRIQWGLRGSRDTAAKILEGYIDQEETNPGLASAAFDIYRDIVEKDPPQSERFQK